MAEQKDVQATTPVVDLEALGGVIGEAVALGIAKTQRKKITIGEYEPLSAFHPGPKALKPKLTRVSMQNGFRLHEDTLYDEEINLLNKLTHSGRYLERKVEVVVNQDGADETVDVRFACRTPDQRIELKGLARDFKEILRQIVAAQAEEHEEIQVRKDQRAESRRTFGETKAYREAREKAGA